MLEQFRNYIPVEAFHEERVERQIIAVPNVGLRWGQSSEFIYNTEADTANKERDNKGGMKPVIMRYHWGPIFGKTREVDEVYDYSPVWREYEIIRVYVREELSDGSFRISSTNYFDIEATISMLVPAGTHSRKVQAFQVLRHQLSPALDIKTGVIEIWHDVPYFLRMYFPTVMPDAERIGKGTEGEWPKGVQIA